MPALWASWPHCKELSDVKRGICFPPEKNYFYWASNTNPFSSSLNWQESVSEYSSEKEEGRQQLWRLVSESKKYVTSDESGDAFLSGKTSPEGWEEWELTRTEQQSGNPILTLRNHKSGRFLFAYQGTIYPLPLHSSPWYLTISSHFCVGNKSKVVCERNVTSDTPEIYFTLENVEAKKLLGSKKQFRTFKTHHSTFLGALSPFSIFFFFSFVLYSNIRFTGKREEDYLCN